MLPFYVREGEREEKITLALVVSVSSLVSLMSKRMGAAQCHVKAVHCSALMTDVPVNICVIVKREMRNAPGAATGRLSVPV